MIETEEGKLMLSKGQPGMFLKMRAKAGKGDALFELSNKLHYNGDPDGPVDWVLCRDKNDPDIMYAFEFYKDADSFKRHYNDSSLDAGHNALVELVAEISSGEVDATRAEVNAVFSGFQIQ